MLCFLLYHVGNGGNKLFVFVFVYLGSNRRCKEIHVFSLKIIILKLVFRIPRSPLGLPDLDPLVIELRIRIQILSSSIKDSIRKTLISTVFLLLNDFLSLKNDVNVPLAWPVPESKVLLRELKPASKWG
jgi:hypothetical protein